MFINNPGYPGNGSQPVLQRVCDRYWAGEIPLRELQLTAREMRRQHWLLQQQAGADLIPCNEFSLCGAVPDMCLTVSAIPERFHPLIEQLQLPEIDLLLAMSRGYHRNGYAITAMESACWPDSDYQYLVPEFSAGQRFNLLSDKIILECRDAIRLGLKPLPVIPGPVSFLLAGKEKGAGFHRIDLLKHLLPIYKKLVQQLDDMNIRTIQFDEPFLSVPLSDAELKGVVYTYQELNRTAPFISILLASYFECDGSNLNTITSLPVRLLQAEPAI